VLYNGASSSKNMVHQFSWDEAIDFVSALDFDSERFRELVAIVLNRGHKATSA